MSDAHTLTRRPVDGRHYLMVMPGQYTLSYRLPDDQQPGRIPKRWPVYDAVPALEHPWPDDPSSTRDAHTTQYVVVGADGRVRNPAYRVGAGKAELSRAYRDLTGPGKGNRIWMNTLFLDHDTPNHLPWSDLPDGGRSWWEGRLSLLRADPLGRYAGWYHTRKGARYVFLLDPWIDHTVWTPLFLRVLKRFASLAPLPEDKEIDKLKDWTRLMRLPRVYRDGSRRPENYPLDLSGMRPVNLLEALGVTVEELQAEARKLSGDNTGRVTVEVARATNKPGTSEEEECQGLARATLDRQCSYLQKSRTQGERHNSLLIAGRWVGEVIGWLDEASAVSALVAASAGTMSHYGEAERERCIRDGMSFTRESPRDLRDEVETRQWLLRQKNAQVEAAVSSQLVGLPERCRGMADDVLQAAVKAAQRARDPATLWVAALRVGEVSAWLDEEDAAQAVLDAVSRGGRLDVDESATTVARGIARGQAQLRDLPSEIKKLDALLIRESIRRARYA